jgi:hypothetical protein
MKAGHQLAEAGMITREDRCITLQPFGKMWVAAGSVVAGLS